jgi:lysyl-tRNA synthetase class II
VCTELDIEPAAFQDIQKLRPTLETKLSEFVNPKVVREMNEKQLVDKLIENVIEPKSKDHPAFIMNHPMLLSPLAKT